MPAIHRMGDANVAGGAVNSIPQGFVYANGLLVVVNGSLGTSHAPCPDPPHCAGQWVTDSGSATVFINGIPINRQGDADTCGHARASGSPDVFVGG